MELIIRHLSKSKKNTEFQLSLINDDLNLNLLPRHGICENDQISFHIFLESVVEDIRLLIGDREFRHTKSELTESGILYSWLPESYFNGYNAFFHNFFGIATICVKVHAEPILRFCPLEIFSEKITASRCEEMLTYLAAEKNIELLNELSPTGYSLENVESGISAAELVEHVCKTVRELERCVLSIIKRPMTKVRGQLSLVDGKLFEAIDEQSIGWMLENASVLSEAESSEVAHFSFDDDWYFVDEIQANLLFETTDIYENKLLHFFVRKITEGCEKFRRELLAIYTAYENRVMAPTGFVSFFDVMNKTLGKNKEIKIEKLDAAIRTLGKITHYLGTKIPCKDINLRNTLITERIRRDKNYLGFYKVSISWLREKDVDWRSEQLLININSADKLFELYCCAVINNYLHSIGAAKSRNKSLFEGLLYGFDARLLYEPKIWKSGHRNALDRRYLNTELKFEFASKSQHVSGGNKYLYKMPDYVIELTDTKSGSITLLILDAKYMKPDVAYKQLAPLVMDYVLGIHSADGKNIVEGLLLLHPENDIEKNIAGKYIDHHAFPYDLHSPKPVKPVLGLQSIVLSKGGVEQGLFESLQRFFEVSLNLNQLKLAQSER